MSTSTRPESTLASRHRALGSNLEDWNGVGTPWSYTADACDEHDAIRERAGLFDVVGLKKVWVRGPDALAVVDHLITRDMSKIAVGQSAYGLNLTEEGTITDDSIISNMGNDEYLVVHGTGRCMEMLEDSAKGKNVTVETDDTMQSVALQGPKSLEVIDPHTPFDLASLKYFHIVRTTMFGFDVMISRTGYSGERGYEVYSARDNMPAIWDKILEVGADTGVIPCSFDCLDKIRVEAALLFYPYDIHEEISPWEVNMGWAISRKKGDFRGREATFALEGKNKLELVGLVIDHDEALEDGDLYIDGNKVGTVNSPVFSHRMHGSIALAHVTPGNESVGTKLEVRGTVNTTAVIHSLSFYDPEKKMSRD
jgi:aminomethyltransferase